ncbi:HET-domain-containing protein [Colletotrichum zoysiae]|uniref:HET-domain-containing protein n=1 Tax=Colletotrichum zoysiae TaxID=1216348 RepID=A0AAD9H617_9PEZI|nr:HET-domain-containing protein [Colletotrichum zoysiae]
MHSATYQYGSLPLGRWFRLLHIHPGQAHDPLVCDLVTVDLESNPLYKALSYVWGDPSILAEITCSGFRRPVTVSLLDGLRRLRHPTRIETAWADAICINQSDNNEKAYQVNLMGLIYDKATEVVVWLGQDSNNSAETAFEGFRTTNAAIQNGTHMTHGVLPGAFLTLTNQDGQKSAPFPVNQRKNNLEQILKAQHLTAIKELFLLPWFTRVWVLQEVGLATEATAFWGDSHIAFREIAMFINFAMTDENMNFVLEQDIKDIISGPPYYAFWSVWSTYNKKDSWVSRCAPLQAFADQQVAECQIDFLVVLEASRRFSATNALDHVFAFLGHPKALVTATNQPIVQADYNMALEDLHVAVASRLAEMSLNFLVQVQNQPFNLDPGCNDPSWVPKWDVNDDEAPNAFWEAWDASLRVTKRPTFSARLSSFRLHVSALLFDTVTEYTDVMKKADFDRSSSGPGTLIEKCWDLTAKAAKTHPHVYGDDELLSFALTLVCHYRRTQTDREEYSDLVALFVRFCSIYSGSLWKKLERFGISFTHVHREGYVGKQFQHYGTNRRFFVGERGYWGLGPSLMRKGDVCAILFGADVPIILRPCGRRGQYRLVGQAYMNGAMYGEIVEKWEEGDATWEKEDVCLI